MNKSKNHPVVVKVDGKLLTYSSGGYRVNIGDTVTLPTPEWKRDMDCDLGDTFEATVVAVTNVTNWVGATRPILGVVSSPLYTDNEIVDLVKNAKVVFIDGQRYSRKSGWMRD